MTTQSPSTYYVTTPIYYVNDRPHIGHIYTTTLADILARYHRLCGDDVFFLTGTDEHAAKVSDAAAERDLTPQQWADQNAKIFNDTFTELGLSHDDFIRTSQDRHKQRVVKHIQKLLDSGDVYEGTYEGWYDAGQEEYLPETKAKEYDYRSPFNGKPLKRKVEKNYFFRLSHYAQRLLDLIEAQPDFIQPTARRNEVCMRIKEGLHDVPISRSGTGGWGIAMPQDDSQTIYVWIDALFNYLTTVQTDQHERFWPASVHLIAKDILWFHAVIWPAILMALDLPLPGQIYAHSFWISEGQKMSKSLGNFIDLEKITDYRETFSFDALRWFLATQGPLGATDSDFAHRKFVDCYHADLANTLGNCTSRVTNMIHRYFDGQLPTPEAPETSSEQAEALRTNASGMFADLAAAYAKNNVAAANQRALEVVKAIDAYIEQTQPFKLAKLPEQQAALGTILYNCAEALRIATLGLHPTLPEKTQAIWAFLGVDYDPTHGKLADWTTWGQLAPGTSISKATPLFPRITE